VSGTQQRRDEPYGPGGTVPNLGQPEIEYLSRSEDTAASRNLSPINFPDAAENRTSESQFRQQSQLLAQAEKCGGLAAREIDMASRKMKFSENLCRMLAYPGGPTSFYEEDYWYMVHTADRDDARQIATSAIRDGAPYEYIARIYGADH